MRTLPLVLSLAVLLACFGPLRAESPATTQSSSTVVGSIYGKTVTAADVGLTVPIDPTVQFDSRETATWELMGRILTAFGKPVIDRFIEEKRIEVTADEIKALQDHMGKRNQKSVRQMEVQLEKVNSDLASPDLPDEDKARLEEEQATLENILPALRDVAKRGVSEAPARQFIVAWKIERELHRTYGGRVIFQQAGPEALDARRQLFEQAEENGDLRFEDAGVRHLFYYYANMKHTVIDEKAIERPWFLEDQK